MTLNQKRRVLFIGIFTTIGLLAFFITKLAQGYKPDLSTASLKPTGLLVATSKPDAAQLWIDGKLKSATNTTLSLTPGEYEIEIKKDGFFTWHKKLILKKELVTKTDAYLFTTYPDLKALTFTGAANSLLSPDGQKVAFSVATASASKRGIWVLDLADRPLGFNREPRQILESPPAARRDFSQAEYEWAPDSKQLLVKLKTESFLVDPAKLNPNTTLINVSQTIGTTKKLWQSEEEIRQKAKISKLPQKLLASLENNVENIKFSPDETKILYTATASASIPEKIITPLPAASDQPQARQFEPGKLYVYDLKEDRNFLIPANLEAQVSWFPTSNHIFIVQDGSVSIVEYDAGNWTDIYTGPLENSFAFPFPSATKILILTAIGQNTPNLYAISLQ